MQEWPENSEEKQHVDDQMLTDNSEETFTGICPKCDDTGIVKEEDGSAHVCWDCLKAGRLDVHSKDVSDSGLRI